MIDKFVSIPVTEDSRPFMSAADKCDFKTWGYCESEFLFYGKANIYGKDKENITKLAADAPYINRFMVRYPSDPKKASGNVIIEILNASTAMDIDRMWILSKEFLMRNGDVFVAVSSKPVTVPALMKFDMSRYHDISWKNPRENVLPISGLGNMSAGGDSSPLTENGLFWDMLTDLADAFREGNVPVNGIVTKRLYLTGWSQSGSYMVRYVNDIVPLRNKSGKYPVFDGYLAGGTGYIVVPGLNQSESPAYIGGPDVKIQHTASPYIAVHTESENARLGGYEASQPDSDEPLLKYRRYEIPGSTHDSYYNMTEYYRGSDDMERAGIYLRSPGVDPYPNNYPYEYVFHAAWFYLFRWVEKGIPAPKIPRIEVKKDYTNVFDESGNAKGGWRQPAIDLPVCRYHPISRPLRADFSMDCYLYGYREFFSIDTLKRLYGSLSGYSSLVQKKAYECAEQGLLLKEDMEACIERTVAIAMEAGLK